MIRFPGNKLIRLLEMVDLNLERAVRSICRCRAGLLEPRVRVVHWQRQWVTEVSSRFGSDLPFRHVLWGTAFTLF